MGSATTGDRLRFFQWLIGSLCAALVALVGVMWGDLRQNQAENRTLIVAIRQDREAERHAFEQRRQHDILRLKAMLREHDRALDALQAPGYAPHDSLRRWLYEE